MKAVLKISNLLVAAVLMFSSCEKEDPLQPDKKALKLITVADNSEGCFSVIFSKI